MNLSSVTNDQPAIWPVRLIAAPQLWLPPSVPRSCSPVVPSQTNACWLSSLIRAQPVTWPLSLMPNP
jgi:hypothetical protein